MSYTSKFLVSVGKSRQFGNTVMQAPMAKFIREVGFKPQPASNHLGGILKHRFLRIPPAEFDSVGQWRALRIYIEGFPGMLTVLFKGPYFESHELS